MMASLPARLQELRFALRDLGGPGHRVLETATHVREAIAWLYRAQDATPDGGVSHSYRIGKGWSASYPETTGYIIPTLLNWSQMSGDNEARTRALAMARWESSIQHADGGVIGSVIGGPVARGVVFNTGQVLFGWVAAFRASGETSFLDAAMRGTRWLGDQLGGAETWVTCGNMGQDLAHAYNVRVVWGMLEVARLTDDRALADRVGSVADWVLGQEEDSGWFRLNCLSDNSRPLLHTIAYTAQGLLECGRLLNRDDCLAAARRTADALLEHLEPDGRLAGRFDVHWNPAARWVCLTGLAQMAVVWSRLATLTGEARYAQAARRANHFLKATQDTRVGDPGIRGGIQGSFPISGGYGTYRLLNWAAKFFVDSLLLEIQPTLASDEHYLQG